MKIFVAVDLSAGTSAVVAAARDIAESRSCEIFIFHVAAPDSAFVSYRAGPQHERDWRAEAISKEHTRLEELASELAGENRNVRPIIVEGPTADKIIDEATRVGADLIILGSHGHGALFHLVAGSVTMAVLHSTKIPVLVVPVAGHSEQQNDE